MTMGTSLDQMRFLLRNRERIAQLVPGHDPDQPTATIIDLGTARIQQKATLGRTTSEYYVAA